MLSSLCIFRLGLVLLSATLCYASPAPDPQSKLLNLPFSGAYLSPYLDCVRGALGKCNPPPPKIPKCPAAQVCAANGVDNPCCGPLQTCTATGCVGPIDCTAGVCGNACCPTPPPVCPKTCGSDCCTNDPNQVGYFWCPPSPVGICCSIYDDVAALDSNGQNPICCLRPAGYQGILMNCDNHCCEGQCATVIGAALGPYPACQATVDACTISTPCRFNEDCVGWNNTAIPNSCLPSGCCSDPVIHL